MQYPAQSLTPTIPDDLLPQHHAVHVDDPGAAAQTEAVLGLVLDSLGDAVVGAYPHGSAVLGGLRPSSDLDVLVVLRRSMTPPERRAVVDGLLDLSGRRARRGPARPVELTAVVQSDVRPWRYPPRVDFQYGEWLRDEYEHGVVPLPTPSPDLAPVLTMVLLGNAPLLGPLPGEVLDPVPHSDLVRALVAGVAELLDDLDSDTRNVVLTLARIWTTLGTGTIKAKHDAAAWAIVRLPEEHRAVLAHASAVYLGHEDERWDDLRPRIRPHCDHVVAEIARLSP